MQRLIYLGGVGLLGLLLYSQAVRGDQLPQVQILEINASKGQEATTTLAEDTWGSIEASRG